MSQPVSRRLRVLAFDPSLATRLDTATMNQLSLSIPWEEVGAGPVGEYVEVIDYDPASGVYYKPVDLNHKHLLAQDGLPPSESDPQFHQQMVYAVAMTTIHNFERALGRVAFWADREEKIEGRWVTQFVRRLRIYPHALRDRNAYYSPAKKALLFGYFPVTRKDKNNTPGTVVFTCLSHDIVAHEVTHALLDGIHPRFNESSNEDVHAFHEAFADIVSLFQHFSFPRVLEHQIRRTRGNLETESLLSQLAQQFGQATGRGSALRDALGHTDENRQWQARKPDPRALEKTHEPHARGSVLVAAVFRAFLLIYRSRTADLFRIATNGTGMLPEGDIHPDLTNRLAAEAAECADRVLQMCIRAIDYCPPVNITFGDFLRGIVTGDLDYSPEDEGGYRIVFIQSFREWGIHPRNISSMGEDALAWASGDELMQDKDAREHGASSTLERTARIKGVKNVMKTHLRGLLQNPAADWNLESDRFSVWKSLGDWKEQLWFWLHDGDSYGRAYAELFGLVINDSDAPRTVYRNAEGQPAVEVHSVRPAVRRTRHGGTRTDLVVEITQRRRGYFDPKKQEEMDALYQPPMDRNEDGDFKYRAGCTILIAPDTQEVRRIIRTPGTIADDAELERVRKFRTGESGVTGNAFDAGLAISLSADSLPARREPFALLHEHEESNL